MEHTTTTHIALKPGQVLEQSIKELNVTRHPNYYRVGNGIVNRHKIESIDFIQAVMDMTKAEQLVIQTIKDLLTWENETGEVYVPLSEMFTKSENAVFRKGFALLKKKDLVRRTKPSHYMVNPNALIPRRYDEGLRLWEQGKSK